MKAEDVSPDKDEEYTYVPVFQAVLESSALIFDPVEFADLTNSIAAVMWEGNLLVLDRDTLELRNPAKIVAKPRGLSTVKP